MSLWANKYRPRTLKDLDYHSDVSKKIERLSGSGDFPHLLVYGPPGAGKKTRVMVLLHELYGSGVEKMKVDVKTFKTSSSRKLEFNVVSSPYHLEITPSDMGNNDRIVIQDLLKDMGETESIDYAGILRKVAPTVNSKKFKVVVINEAELLSRDAQAALRRTMEKFSANIRLVLVCDSTSSIIDPIKSRTLSVRIGLPTIEETTTVFDKILKREHQAAEIINESDRPEIYKNIYKASDGNLRMGIMMLEAMYMNNDKVTKSTKVIVPDWEDVIRDLARKVVKDRSVAQLQQTRTTFYELLAHAIPARLILKKLTGFLWETVPSRSRPDIVDAASLFDERLSLGSKDIFHLEGFICRVMVILEKQK